MWPLKLMRLDGMLLCGCYSRLDWRWCRDEATEVDKREGMVVLGLLMLMRLRDVAAEDDELGGDVVM